MHKFQLAVLGSQRCPTIVMPARWFRLGAIVFPKVPVTWFPAGTIVCASPKNQKNTHHLAVGCTPEPRLFWGACRSPISIVTYCSIFCMQTLETITHRQQFTTSNSTEVDTDLYEAFLCWWNIHSGPPNILRLYFFQLQSIIWYSMQEPICGATFFFSFHCIGQISELAIHHHYGRIKCRSEILALMITCLGDTFFYGTAMLPVRDACPVVWSFMFNKLIVASPQTLATHSWQRSNFLRACWVWQQSCSSIADGLCTALWHFGVFSCTVVFVHSSRTICVWTFVACWLTGSVEFSSLTDTPHSATCYFRTRTEDCLSVNFLPFFHDATSVQLWSEMVITSLIAREINQSGDCRCPQSVGQCHSSRTLMHQWRLLAAGTTSTTECFRACLRAQYTRQRTRHSWISGSRVRIRCTVSLRVNFNSCNHNVAARSNGSPTL